MGEDATHARAADIDPMARATIQCPYPFYELLRAEGPVYRVPQGGYYIATTHEVAQQVFKDPQTFSNNIYGEIVKTRELAAVYMTCPTLSQADPPRHAPLRRIVERFFTPARIAAQGAAIRTLADELIDAFVDAGHADLGRDFAVPLTILVLADTLGVDRALRHRFKEWSTAYLMAPQGTLTEAEEIVIARTIDEGNKYLLGLFHERRGAPRDDVISVLANAEMEDEDGRHPVPDEQFVTVMQQLVSGGNETTSGTITAGALLMIRQPELQQRLRDDPAFVDSFIEETLRFESPIQGLWRRVTRDTVLAGVPLPEGAILNIRMGCANRDETTFAQPQAFDPARADVGAHLAFGTGIHLCVGRNLARRELKCAYAALANRLQDIRLAPGALLEYRHAFLERSLVSLPVVFGKRAG